MNLLTPKETESKVKLSWSKIHGLVREGRFPEPIRVASNRVAFLDHEIDEWLAARAAERGLDIPAVAKPGLIQFWADVKAGVRPHPRTLGRLRKQAAQSQDKEAA